jgi:Uma2 family endonuclease
MSSTKTVPDPLDFGTFLEAFGEKDERYELHHGEVFAMAGGSTEHGLISLNTAIGLKNLSRTRGCQTFGSDVYVRFNEDETSAMLPDAFVRCGPPVPKGQRFISDPLVIVEVLSPSTMGFDRGEKLRRYQGMSSVQHVVILYQDEYRAEIWTRPPAAFTETDTDGYLIWDRAVANGLDGTISLPALDGHLAMRDIYEGVELS